MSNEAVHLLFALNRWEMKNEIIKMMNDGTTVICDRYAYSGIVYSAAKVSTHIIAKNILFRVWTTIGVLEQTED